MIRILIVDDHASIRDSFRSAFEQYDDLKVVGSVADAAFALFFCRDKQPDLVLMDINMPVMDGYEALRGVREISPDVPVIALTAYAFETDRYRMFQAGFNECLAKPLRADELRTRIAALLSR